MNGRQQSNAAERQLWLFALICTGMILLGSAMGACSAGITDGGTVRNLLSGMDSYGIDSSSDIFRNVCPIVLTAVFGLTLFGKFLIPVIGLLRGFLAGYSISAIMRSVAEHGFLYALERDGAVLFVTVPFFLSVSVIAMRTSSQISAGVRSGGRNLRPSVRLSEYILLMTILLIIPCILMMILRIMF